MRTLKKAVSVVLCAAMIVSLSPAGNTQAAKKLSLQKKLTVTAGKSKTLKVKNAVKSTKVTWKTSKKSVVKLGKKVSKGKKARVVVKGVKAGTAKVTATYKAGKKKKTLKCNVTVKPASNVPGGKEQTAAPSVSPVITQTAAPSASAVPTATPTVKPTRKPTASPTPKPTATPVPSPDAQAYKTYVDINVDGVVDQTWDFADELEFKNFYKDEGQGDTGVAQTSNAKAKMLWTDKYFYVLVTADDPEIDLTNEAVYLQDSVELFFDENNIKKDYPDCKAFQYRLVINPNADTENPAGTLTDKNNWEGGDIVSAVKTTETGYVCEFAIPLNAAPVTRNFTGVDIQINDASKGTRNGTWNLFANPANGDAIPYDSTAVFGDVQYIIKTQPKVIPLKLTEDNLDMQLPDQFKDNPDYAEMNTQSKLENGMLFCKTANNAVVYFSDGSDNTTVLKGEKAKIKVTGSYAYEPDTDLTSTAFRMWMVDSNSRALTGDSPVTTSNQEIMTIEQLNLDEEGNFEIELEFTACEGDKPADDGYESKGNCDGIMIKAGSYNGMLGDLVIKSVVITVDEPIRNDNTNPAPENPDNPENPTEPEAPQE